MFVVWMDQEWLDIASMYVPRYTIFTYADLLMKWNGIFAKDIKLINVNI